MGSGIDKRTLKRSVYQVLIGLSDVVEATQWSEGGRYTVLPANRELAGAELELVDFDERETRLKDALTPVAAQYDFILIDCPPSLSLLTLNGFCAAHGVIIPMQCEYYALEGLSDLVNTIKKVHANFNTDLTDDRPAARDVRSAHHAVAAGVGAARAALRRQGVPHGHSAQRAPGRGAQLRPAGRGVRPRSPRARAPTSSSAPN